MTGGSRSLSKEIDRKLNILGYQVDNLQYVVNQSISNMNNRNSGGEKKIRRVGSVENMRVNNYYYYYYFYQDLISRSHRNSQD